MITSQTRNHPHQPCACVSHHGGSGRYAFLGPDGGHYRRSNYTRRVFRPACDGRHEAAYGCPARVVITDQTAWPGIPIAFWRAAKLSTNSNAEYLPPAATARRAFPRKRRSPAGSRSKPGLTPHGLRHIHMTWMAEEDIP